MTRVSHGIDRIEVVFDDPTLVADAGLVLPATLMVRLGVEAVAVFPGCFAPVFGMGFCLSRILKVTTE